MPVLNANKNWDDFVACAETVARSPGFQTLRDRILAEARIESGHEVLDLGSGTGLLTLPAAQVARRVWALDISERMGDYLGAKARSAALENVETVVASVVSVPLVDASVDVVVSNYCFHHVGDEEKLRALQEAMRVLVPGGRLVIGDMMFSLSLNDDRNRGVLKQKVRGLLAKGPGGVWRLARNGARYATGRWERPATPDWWRLALARTGFSESDVVALEHEGGIASVRKPPA